MPQKRSEFNDSGRNHGMDHLDYFAQLRAQKGGCAICHEPPAPGKVLAWDHDHNHCSGAYGCPECTRGLLCTKCNTRISVIENVDRRPFIAYLDEWKMMHVFRK